MTRVAEYFDFGTAEGMTVEELVVKLERMYFDLASSINSKPDLYQRDTNGQTSDTFLAQGSININTTTRKVEMLTEHSSATTVVWTTLS